MLKDRLIKKYGTLRKCSTETKIGYYRLSHIVNGYVKPKPEEIKALGITKAELEGMPS